MKIDVPYGKKTLPLKIPERNLLEIVEPHEYQPPESSKNIVKNALQQPMGTGQLAEIAARGDRVSIVVDDYTRPCPNEKLLMPVLEELKNIGVRDANVKIIIANGTHKPPNYEKIREIIGDKTARNYNVVTNNSKNSEHVKVGVSKFGHDIEVLKDYVEADVKILLGDIEYHYFAGYGGTRKSILPGISSELTVQNNHSMLFEKNSKTGVLKNNPVSEEMHEALNMAGCDFALSVVLNSKHQIVGAWSGHPDSVMDAGVKLVDKMYKVEIEETPDIVVVGANGHPHDIDLYQAMKALHTATQVVKKSGVIVLIAETPMGPGKELYVNWLKRYKTSKEIQVALQKKFIIGAHKAYYHRKAIENYHVIFVSSMDESVVENTFGFKYANNPDEALKKAFEITGDNRKTLVVPQGTTTHLVRS